MLDLMHSLSSSGLGGRARLFGRGLPEDSRDEAFLREDEVDEVGPAAFSSRDQMERDNRLGESVDNPYLLGAKSINSRWAIASFFCMNDGLLLI